MPMRIVLSLLVCLTVPALGQSTLPPCDPNVAAAGWTNCQATSTDADGHEYSGEHRGGKRHGRGTYTFSNGNKYVGEFRDDRPNGQGTLTYADGRPPQEGVILGR